MFFCFLGIGLVVHQKSFSSLFFFLQTTTYAYPYPYTLRVPSPPPPPRNGIPAYLPIYMCIYGSQIPVSDPLSAPECAVICAQRKLSERVFGGGGEHIGVFREVEGGEGGDGGERGFILRITASPPPLFFYRFFFLLSPILPHGQIPSPPPLPQSLPIHPIHPLFFPSLSYSIFSPPLYPPFTPPTPLLFSSSSHPIHPPIHKRAMRRKVSA